MRANKCPNLLPVACAFFSHPKKNNVHPLVVLVDFIMDNSFSTAACKSNSESFPWKI
jgi:hypothetical protein